MALFNTGNQFPYTNFHDLNLDWIIREVKKALEDWVKLRGEWSAYQVAMDSAWAAYKSAIDADLAAYKANLNQEWTDYQVQNNAEFQAFKTALEGRQDKVEGDFDDLKQFVLDYFDNVDWAQLLEDLMNEWYANGTLIRLIAPYLPFITPEMYGAVADGVVDDSDALNQLMTAGAGANKAIWFSPNTTFRVASPVEIPGTVDIHGNGATIEADAGVSALVFSVPGPESTIDNLTINSDNSRWPDLGITSLDDFKQPGHANWRNADCGLKTAGEHLKLTRLNINNFGIGLFHDDSLTEGTQTGTIVENCHIRYCGVGARIGYTYGYDPGRSTDWTFSDCTFAGRHCGLFYIDAIGCFFNNVHTWGLQDEGNRPLVGLYLNNASITNLNRIYIEPCELYAAHIHTRKGLNIDNFCYVASFGYRADQPVVFDFDGSTGYRVNLDNIEIRPGTPEYDDGKPYVKPILIHQGNRGTFNIGNVITSELLRHNILNPSTGQYVDVNYASILPGVAYDITAQTYGYFYQNNAIMQLKSNQNLLQIGGKMLQVDPKEIALTYDETTPQSGSARFDLSTQEKGRPLSFEIYTTSRDVDDNVTVGRYTVGCVVKAGQSSSDPVRGDVVAGLTTLAADSGVSISLGTGTKNALTITVTQTGPKQVNIALIEVKNLYFALSQTPETNPYN